MIKRFLQGLIYSALFCVALQAAARQEVAPEVATPAPRAEARPIVAPQSPSIVSTETLSLPFPLSPLQVDQMLGQAEDLVNQGLNTTASLRQVGALEPLLSRCADYMARLADHEARNIHFRWRPLSKEPVEPGETKTETLDLENPMDDVFAIRFKALYGEVILVRFTVFGPNGPLETRRVERTVYHDLPRKETFFLRERAQVARLVFVMRYPPDQEGRKRRMQPELGVPSEPAYARETSALCRESLALLYTREWEQARVMLDRARDRLGAYLEREGLVERPRNLLAPDPQESSPGS